MTGDDGRPAIDLAAAAAALDEVGDAVAVLDSEGAIRWSNAAWRRLAGCGGLEPTLAVLRERPDAALRRIALADGGTLLVAGTGDAALFRDILDGLDATVVVYDQLECYRFGNAAYHRLYPHHPPEAELIGRTFEQMLRRSLAAGYVAEPQAGSDPEAFVHRRLAEFRDWRQGDMERISPGGRWDLLQARTTGSGLRVTMRTEITAQKAIQEELRRAKEELETESAERERFVGRVGRELRGPLSSVLGYMEIIEGEYLGPLGSDRYRDYARLVLEAGRQMLDMLDALAPRAGGEAEAPTLRAAPVDPVAVLRREMAAVETAAELNRVLLILDLRDRVPRLLADERMLRLMIQNLLSNAVRHAPDGMVATTVRPRDDGGIDLEVRDTGHGMPPEVLARAGEAYFRGPAPPGTEPGTGLGLAMVRDLVALHGGRLSLDSAPGKGTVATLSFPPERIQWPEAEPA